MLRLFELYKRCRQSGTSFTYLVIKALYFKSIKKNILMHQHADIRGARNIKTHGILHLGTDYVGFNSRKDQTVLNINGKAIFNGSFSIGRGCRMDIGSNATARFGKNSFVNPFTLFVIMNELEIGDNCAISWYCQFLDEDFHEIQYEGKKEKSKSIIIGNNVWIGANTCIYKGTTIPDGCVVASSSVVRGIFTEKNVLIAGNPAKVIKQNISWK
jgi:acetyltransferase-like isoleucine patch superfamily enzyme